EVPAEEFGKARGTNVPRRGETLVRFVFPPRAENSGSAYERFIPRNEMDIAVVGAASWVQLNAAGDTIERARVGLVAIAPTPVFAAEASRFLVGKRLTEETFAQAGELARQVAAPIDAMRGTVEFRRQGGGPPTQGPGARGVEGAGGKRGEDRGPALSAPIATTAGREQQDNRKVRGPPP